MMMRKKSPGSSSPSRLTTPGGNRSPRRMASSASLHEILADNRPQLLNRGGRHHGAVGDERMLQRRAALAGAFRRHVLHGMRDNFTRVRRVLLQHPDNVGN